MLVRFRMLAALSPGKLWNSFLLILVLILSGSALLLTDTPPLSLPQGFFFDTLQQLHPRERDQVPVLVVAIDENSLAKLGQWPWSRQKLAEIVNLINAGEPLAIGLDMVFPEPDRLDPKYLTTLNSRQNTRSLPHPDALFATALSRSPSVLGVAATNGLPLGGQTSLRSSPVISRGGDSGLFATPFSSVITNLPQLESAARSQALLNPRSKPSAYDPEHGILRRMPLMASIAGLPVPGLGPEMIRVALNSPSMEVEVTRQGIQQITIGPYSLPTQSDGSIMLRFGPLQADRYISALDLLEGRIPPQVFKDRFVLIGFTGIGLQDLVVTPLGEKIPGVDAHAQVIESILDGTILSRPAGIQIAEGILFLCIGLVLIFTLPQRSPIGAITLALSIGIALFLLSYLLFLTHQLLLDSISLVILLSPTFLFLFRNLLVSTELQRQETERNLQASRETEARMLGELDAARQIQQGLLPDPKHLPASETRFSLAARLEPAREVGGDYFDFFLLSDEYLYFTIGDVSGKGLPASLFMAMTKSVSETLIRQYPNDLETVINTLNQALSRNNREMLFVTTFIGVLNLTTGDLEYVCAGHNAPYRLNQATLEPLPIRPINGPPLCTCADFPYSSGKLRLHPGDFLVLITDGITEAHNGNDWFGEERLKQGLRKAQTATPSPSPEDLITAITSDVRAFEAGIAPFDDLTLLILQWHPQSSLEQDTTHMAYQDNPLETTKPD